MPFMLEMKRTRNAVRRSLPVSQRDGNEEHHASSARRNVLMTGAKSNQHFLDANER